MQVRLYGRHRTRSSLSGIAVSPFCNSGDCVGVEPNGQIVTMHKQVNGVSLGSVEFPLQAARKFMNDVKTDVFVPKLKSQVSLDINITFLEK